MRWSFAFDRTFKSLMASCFLVWLAVFSCWTLFAAFNLQWKQTRQCLLALCANHSCRMWLSSLLGLILFYRGPRSGELRTQKLKSYLVRTQSLNDLLLKPGVGQYIAVHATLTARDFFLAYFCPSGPITRTFLQNLSRFFLCWLWLTHGSSVGPQNQIGYLAGGRFSC